MILGMQVLQCPMIELQDRIDQELQENVFLEVLEGQDGEAAAGTNADGAPAAAQEIPPALEEKLQSQFSAELDQLEARTDRYGEPIRRESVEEADRRLEALYNTPAHDLTLPEYLLEQARMLDLDADLYRVVEHLIFSLDDDGRLTDTVDDVARELGIPLPLAEEAFETLRSFDPPGVGARDLRDCLLMQIDRLSYVRPLTREIVEFHLDDIAMNKLPKIARDRDVTIDEVKESIEFLRTSLRPHPGSGFAQTRNATVVPDVVVEEVDGRFEVRAERGSLPELRISPVYRALLKEASTDPKVYEYLRRKIDAAKWFIEAVHQRQSTIQRIAGEIVQRQSEFLRRGVQHLRPMKMQDIAEVVGVSISTVSRAISGKYIQTPQGIFDMKRFFSGGTETDSGQMISQQAVKDLIRKIVDLEDKSSPRSDDELVSELARQGIHIARRTVTKYRKALGIDSSTRRKVF
jgi:RNA polymerase sigma-54 factor